MSGHRKEKRIPVGGVVFCRGLNLKNEVVAEHILVAKDISMTGIALQTFNKADFEYAVLSFEGVDQNHVEIECQIVRCKKESGGGWILGMKFLGIDEEAKMFVKNLVRLYHYQDDKSNYLLNCRSVT